MELVLPPRLSTAHVTWGDAIRCLRVRDWLHFLALPLASLSPSVPIGWARLLGSVALAAMLLGYAYGINAVTDRKLDAGREKNALRGLDRLPPRVYLLVGGVALSVLGLGLAQGPVALGAAILSLLASTAYSAGPRVKAWPVAGTLTNVLIFAPLLALGLDDLKVPVGFATLALSFSFLLVQNQLLHERADRVEDQRGAVRTTAQLLSPPALAGLVVLLGVMGAAIVPWVAPRLGLARACQAAVLVAALVALVPVEAAGLRRLHRVVACIGGAAAFVAQWIFA